MAKRSSQHHQTVNLARFYLTTPPAILGPALISTVVDQDSDGVLSWNDCDDVDPVGSSVNDADCDGVPTSEDCDDSDPNLMYTIHLLIVRYSLRDSTKRLLYR